MSPDRFRVSAVIPAEVAKRPPSRDPLTGTSLGAARFRVQRAVTPPRTHDSAALLNGSRLSLRSAGMTAAAIDRPKPVLL